MFGNIRARFLAMPKKAAKEVITCEKPAEAERVVKLLVYEILDELTIPDFKIDEGSPEAKANN